MAASLNLVLGFLGQLSLGHCGFMAVGAYTAALISLAFQRAGVYAEKSGPAFLLVLLSLILQAHAAKTALSDLKESNSSALSNAAVNAELLQDERCCRRARSTSSRTSASSV